MQHSHAQVPRSWVFAFVISIPSIYVLVLFAFWGQVGPRDFDQFLVFHELQYWNEQLFGLAKQWSPLLCSGVSLAGEPQVPFASLTMLLTYLIGPVRGLALGTGIYLVIGWLGAYLYSGLWFRESLQRALAASLFIGNGFFICRMAYGHIDFIPFLALPLALWVLHLATAPGVRPLSAVGSGTALLLLGALFAVVIDGSPVAIVHWLFWIAVYSVALSYMRRSPFPALFFCGACAVCSLLDAGYLWPMLKAQTEFPRLTADTFTGPWSLLWFMLTPMRGKLLPANGKGLELSVFVGPVLLYLVWRYRRGLLAGMPATLKTPLIVVGLISILMGMGSLHVLHVPTMLSLFDSLRPLPGFRSIGVTGRYWGFLALPSSLLATAALWRFLHDELRNARWTALLMVALVVQLGFQGESLVALWFPARTYTAARTAQVFRGDLESIRAIRFAETAKDHQGEWITPTQEVINCYDMDDFLRADVRPGNLLIKEFQVGAARPASDSALRAGYISWNHIRVVPPRDPSAFGPDAVRNDVRIVLNQAYNSDWQAPGCAVDRGAENNLVLRCSAARLKSAPVDLVFFDSISQVGMQVSRWAWSIEGTLLSLLALALCQPYWLRQTGLRT